MIETTAEKIVVDVPTNVTLDKKVVIGVAAGAIIGAGATFLALELKKRRNRKAANVELVVDTTDTK